MSEWQPIINPIHLVTEFSICILYLFSILLIFDLLSICHDEGFITVNMKCEVFTTF